MLPLILYIPMAFALGIVFAFAVRAVLRGYGGRAIAGLTLLLAIALGGSLFLMFVVAEPWSRWTAVGIAGLVVVPLLTPITLLLLNMVLSWLSGKPIRWN
jgi:hypothetical protein